MSILKCVLIFTLINVSNSKLFSKNKLLNFLFIFLLKITLGQDFVTCDFDLLEKYPLQANEILFELPEPCKEIYIKQNDEFQSLKNEAELFNKFQNLLNEKEEYNPEIEYTEDNFPEKQWNFRMDLYSDNEFAPCYNETTDVLTISECIINQRNEMISFLQLNITKV